MRESVLPVGPEEAFAWHARPGALQRLTPPWEPVVLESAGGGIQPGSRVVLRVGRFPLRVRWVAEHGEMSPGRLFTDRQVSGPFAAWEHRHVFEPHEHGSVLRDEVEYRIPMGMPGRVLGGRLVRRKVSRMFAYRHAVTLADLEHHARYDGRRLRVAISGAGGAIGSALAALLTTGGHEVLRLVRAKDVRPDAPGVRWDVERGVHDPGKLDGVDAIVHLAGEPLRPGPGSGRRLGAIRSSRVDGTKALVASLREARVRVPVFIGASGVGYYGSPGEGAGPVSEGAPAGQGFFAELARDWEREAGRAEESLGSRVAVVRLGVVLTPAGGALRAVLPSAGVGLGAMLGHGGQAFPWVSIDDAVCAIHHALARSDVRGPVNVVAPERVTNRAFVRTLARVLGRPAPLRLPAALVRVLVGRELSREVLESADASPGVLETTGYIFRHSTLEAALRHVLGRPGEEQGR